MASLVRFGDSFRKIKRTRPAFYLWVLWVSSTFLLTPHVTSTATADKSAAAKAEYRIIFPTSSAGTAKTVKSEDEAVRASKFESFVEQLNHAGAQGFRLTSFTYLSATLPVGLVTRTGARYEYKWLELGSRHDWLDGAGGFKQKFAPLARNGFRLADHSSIELYCEDNSCATVTVFLVEREIGVEKPTQFAVIGWDEKPLVPAVVELKQKLSQGLFPKQIFGGYDIWFEEGDLRGNHWPIDAELELVWYDASWWGSDTNKSVNKLARRGYRVGLVNWDTAIMYRDTRAGGFNYYWVDAKKKSFERQLAQLQSKGGVYVATYEEENKLIFERRLSDDGKRREYKVLKFEFRFEEDTRANRIRIDLTAPSQEALNELHKRVKEGFVVRDVFVWGKQVGAILERPL